MTPRPTPFEIAQLAATLAKNGFLDTIGTREHFTRMAIDVWDEAAKQINERYPEPAPTWVTIRGTEGLTIQGNDPVMTCLCGAQFTGNGLQGIGPSRCPASPDGYHYVGLPDGSQRWIHVAPKEASGD